MSCCCTNFIRCRNAVTHIEYFRFIADANRPISQIPQCIRQISHNAPFCNRNVHTYDAELWYFLWSAPEQTGSVRCLPGPMFPSPFVPCCMILVPMSPCSPVPLLPRNVSQSRCSQTYITKSLCSTVPMFPIFPSPYVSQSLCSPVPVLSNPFVSQSPLMFLSPLICSPVPMFPKVYSPVPMFPQLVHKSLCFPVLFHRNVFHSLCSPTCSPVPMFPSPYVPPTSSPVPMFPSPNIGTGEQRDWGTYGLGNIFGEHREWKHLCGT